MSLKEWLEEVIADEMEANEKEMAIVNQFKKPSDDDQVQR